MKVVLSSIPCGLLISVAWFSFPQGKDFLLALVSGVLPTVSGQRSSLSYMSSCFSVVLSIGKMMIHLICPLIFLSNLISFIQGARYCCLNCGFVVSVARSFSLVFSRKSITFTATFQTGFGGLTCEKIASVRVFRSRL